MKKEKTKGQILQDTLTWTQPHVADEAPKQIKLAEKFCKGYKTFLDNGKTERECVNLALNLLQKSGYVSFDETAKYNVGDKIYQIIRGKSIIACTIGKESVDKGIRLNIAHIDSPRLDLKPYPLYEDSELALFKTHYYGGIRKYQWVATPLSIHGIVCKTNGDVIEINIGEKENDPVFCISDLLPHLSGEQNKRTLPEGIKGEELNVIVGSLPFEDKDLKDRVKLQVLKLLNEQYGITERDFICAELEIVPAHKAKDVGFDRSIIGSYGHDDRVCAYTSLIAELEVKTPKYTTMCVLTDKEEVGSEGNTGLESDYTMHFMQYLAEMQGVNDKTMLRNSKCLSADVNAAFDPTFNGPFDKRNSCYLNKGCVITKYTGSGGKYSTSDANALFMNEIVRILNDNDVYWQTGELGAVDQGGGGTIAKYIARHNVDVIDIGVPLLSMHAPFELASKLDIYNTYLAFKAFACNSNK